MNDDQKQTGPEFASSNVIAYAWSVLKSVVELPDFQGCTR